MLKALLHCEEGFIFPPDTRHLTLSTPHLTYPLDQGRTPPQGRDKSPLKSYTASMRKILLADDNDELRSALRLLLETRLGVELITEARDMEHVLAQLEDACLDCIILDWELPGHPIRERVSVLRTLVPGLKVVVVSARPESKTEALAEEADAFICKTESPQYLLEVVHGVCKAQEPK